MRSPLTPLLGAALAIGVALSASPAVAAVPTPVPAPDTTLHAPDDAGSLPGTPADPGSEAPTESSPDGDAQGQGEEHGTDVHPNVDVDGTATPDTDTVEQPGLTETDEPADGQQAGEDSLAAADTDAAADETEAEVDPELLSAAPELLSLDGTIAIIADEMPHANTFPVSGGVDGAAAEDGAAHAAGDLVPGRVLVATDAGPLVEIDPALVGEDAVTGDRFEGELTLDAVAQNAVDANIAEAGPVAEAEALETASYARAASGPTPGVVGELIPSGSERQTQGKRAHGADVLFFTGGGNATDAAIKTLVTDTSTYWTNQSNGAITQIRVDAQKRKQVTPRPNVAAKTMRCDARYTEDLWTQGARAFGRTPGAYLGSGRHLIVVVDDNCGKLSGGVAGWGSIGSLHSGGLVWVDAGIRRSYTSQKVLETTGILAHEIGHNLGLGHGNSRLCSGTAVTDAKMTNGRPASPCWDEEYGDVYNLMGAGASSGGKRPIALAISQKHQLGVAPAGSVRSVTASGGRSQTFTLQPGGSSTGLRGLKVESPTGGSYYVEYRNKTGQDSGFRYDSAYTSYAMGLNYYQHRGVRVLKAHTQHFGGVGSKSSTVIPVWDTVSGYTGRFQTMRAGTKSTPWNSTARVTVVSLGNTAKVRVDFTPFVDVPYAHKFGKEINWMSSAKLSTGMNAGSSLRKYAPKSNVTREAMAAFLFRLDAPKSYKAPKKSPFKDVPTNHKFYREIAWMYTSGLSTGIKTSGGRNYAPKSSVTREAMAAFIYRLEGSRYQGAKKSPFADMKPGQRFYKEITWMYSSGLSTGIHTNGKRVYSPKGNVTREAMAAFIYRLKH